MLLRTSKEVSEYFRNFIKKDRLDIWIDNAFKTKIEYFKLNGKNIPKYINEYWTSKQRQASSIHEISYRACFKPQLPHFFIKIFTEPGDIVYDPFSGRGTTIIEAALMGRRVISNDINPLSRILAEPRLDIADFTEIMNTLDEIPIYENLRAEIDLSMFYHPLTEAEIVSLQKYLDERRKNGNENRADRWIRMVATNRLTGHSKGFFSVYTLPPNQAVSPERQKLINQKLNQKPEYRDVKKLILKKSNSLLRNLSESQIKNLRKAYKTALFLENDARHTHQIKSESVKLTVTSPPFLNIVQYSKDNWLRCWFNRINIDEVAKKITTPRSIKQWSEIMQEVFYELFRITKPDGWVAFEVGEVKKGTLKLDEYVVPLGLNAGFECEGILINLQKFTKTSNIWGVNNNNLGTNTNRIVLFHK
ncbi:MAG: DNA methyltransferase [Candidatus Helarchaeota archaeon]